MLNFDYRCRVRKNFCQLRLSAHNLCIESERVTKEEKDRICKICRLSIENEVHFITECYYYENLRQQLYSTLSEIIPNVFTLLYYFVTLSSGMNI